jgi:hypothetical protein
MRLDFRLAIGSIDERTGEDESRPLAMRRCRADVNSDRLSLLAFCAT